jgi:two-component system OmpR family response regulator
MNAPLTTKDLTTKILIVDDDKGIRTLVASFLEKHGFHTDVAGDPIEMRTKLENGRYDLIVLDVMMPREDGLTALRKLQSQNSPPVIMLSAVGTDIDKVVGLEMGAEDYMAKPCNPRELLARIRTVLRRNEIRPSSQQRLRSASDNSDKVAWLEFAGWRMDIMSRVLHNPDDSVVTLSDGEFRLLRAFVEHPRRILSRDQLIDYARGTDTEHYDRAIDVQISRLRRKLSVGENPTELIRTVRSEGYMFVPPVRRS